VPLPGVSTAWIDLDSPPVSPAVLESWLDPTETRRAVRFRFARDRHRWVTARGMLRALLAHQLGVQPSAVPIVIDAFGKPRLDPETGSDVRFSLSHAEGRALFAFARHCQVGVDVEVLRPLRDMESLAGHTFSPRELVEWRLVPTEQRVEAFFNGWTRKEACGTALGRGWGFPLEAFDVSLAPGADPRLLRVSPDVGPAGRWSMHAWSPERGFVAALVLDCGSPDLSP